MPPRKSTDSASAFPSKAGDGETPQGPPSRRGVANHGVEDLNLPRSMVQRLAKGVLPPNTIIHKDALLAMSKSATVFVNYLANNANDRAVLKNKKTIQPNDVFDALDELEFPDFLPRVKTELEIWNTAQCDKRNSYRRRIREEAATKDEPSEAGTNGTSANGALTNGNHKQDGVPPASKKVRLSSGAMIDGDDDMIDDQDDGDETIDEHEGEEDDNLEEDDVVEDDMNDGEEQDEGLEGDMDHNVGDDDDDDNEDEGNESD